MSALIVLMPVLVLLIQSYRTAYDIQRNQLLAGEVDVALAQLQDSLWFSLLVFAIVVVMSLSLALVLARFLLKPLNQLADHAVALGHGELQRRVRISTGDELQKLGEAFNAMAEEVQRALQIREEFLTVAAHELRTPLTIIKGYSQWLLAKEEDEEKRKRFRAVVEQSNRISELLDEMLTVSEIRGGRFAVHKEPVDLASLAREVINRMQLMTDSHRLIFRGEQRAPVEADRSQMEAVMTNLIDNAIRYSPPEGPSPAKIEVAVARRDGGVVVSVRDRGLGIAEDKQQHVFEPFFQIYPAIAGYGGLGLGLFISKEIVERHGGRMWFESAEGEGSTFYFSIPALDELRSVG
ncbi:MAG: HAMP domain-containing histidine kinase [Chloroflexi bacterium]|nr:HAMP domain-containing histidine kinase [Chloroflexota bacterium]